MGETVGVSTLRRLHEHGVRRVFGYPGDGSTGLNLAFHDVPEVEFVQTRHEELAAFAACAHAKLTGEVGVCMATSGPGAIHLLNGLYDARLDGAPVVALVGQQAQTAMGADYQQEVDLLSLFKDVAHHYVQVCTTPEQAELVLDRAVRIARARRTVTAVIFPQDVQAAEAADAPHAHGAVRTSAVPTAGVVHRPDDAALAQAAEVLNAGERVALLVGQGARGAAGEVLAVADRLGAGIAKALNGRAVLPDDLPHVTGAVGLLGSGPSDEMLQGCDTLLLVGTGFPYAEWLPEPGAARAVQIDVDATRLGIRYPTEVNLCGDARDTLAALLPLLRERPDRSWRGEIEANVASWWATLAERAHVSAQPINPQLVFHELSPRLPDRSIVLADSGSATAWWARHLRLRAGMDAAVSGTLASMGNVVPYALAAKLAHPDRPVIACSGDGAMQMLGINGLIDLAHYADRFTGPTVVLVLNNGDLNMVTWEQRAMGGGAKQPATQNLPPMDYAALARGLGLEGLRVERPEDVAGAWDAALAASRPVVLDVLCDPEVPLTPPRVQGEHARNVAAAVAQGDEGAGRFLKQALKEKARDVLGGD